MGQIKFNINKDDALDIVKDAISSKFGILKDNGYELKVGAPMMTATIKVGEGIIDINGSGSGKIVATTCESAIVLAIKRAEKEKNQKIGNNISTTIESSLDKEYKYIQIILGYKKMLDEKIIEHEFYNNKVNKLLELIDELDEESQPNNSTNLNVVNNDFGVIDEESQPNNSTNLNAVNNDFGVIEEECNDDIDDIIINQDDNGNQIINAHYEGHSINFDLKRSVFTYDCDYKFTMIENLKIKDNKLVFNLFNKTFIIIFKYHDDAAFIYENVKNYIQ